MVGRREIVSVSRIGVSSSHGAHCGFHASLGIDHVRLHVLLCAYQSSRRIPLQCGRVCSTVTKILAETPETSKYFIAIGKNEKYIRLVEFI